MPACLSVCVFVYLRVLLLVLVLVVVVVVEMVMPCATLVVTHMTMMVHCVMLEAPYVKCPA